MRKNRMKNAIRNGDVVFGSNITIPDLFSVEVMGSAGMDFLVIEREHSPLSAETLQNVLIALHPTESTVLVRVPSLNEVDIKQALDSGAEGVIIPSVRTRAQCETAIRMARYAPIGQRGVGPRRVGRLYGDREEYIRRANDEVLLLIMIETEDALSQLDEILSVPGLDGVMVGAADLAASMGHALEQSADKVQEAILSTLTACKHRDVPFGIFSTTTGMAERWAREGAQMLTVGSDTQYLDAGIVRTRADVQRIRSEVIGT